MTGEEAIKELEDYVITSVSTKERKHININVAKKVIGKVCDDFENKTCNNCKFYVVDTFYNLHRCQIIKMIETFDNFGCNKWKKQQ